jgi:hypothetical protein
LLFPVYITDFIHKIMKTRKCKIKYQFKPTDCTSLQKQIEILREASKIKSSALSYKRFLSISVILISRTINELESGMNEAGQCRIWPINTVRQNLFNSKKKIRLKFRIEHHYYNRTVTGSHRVVFPFATRNQTRFLQS